MNIMIEFTNDNNELLVEQFERLKMVGNKYMINGYNVSKATWHMVYKQIFTECNKDLNVHYIRA